MTLFEFFVFGLYLAMLIAAMVGIQILDARRPVHQTITVLDSQEKFVQSELEEPESDDDTRPFEPEKEEFTMTENPMFRHRNISKMEMVD